MQKLLGKSEDLKNVEEKKEYIEEKKTQT